MLEQLASYLPQKTGGLLPSWMLLVSVVSVFNSAQCYFGGLALTRRVYEAQPQQVTGLSARTFGTWTVVAAIVRFYAAYNINIQPIYDMALSTYVLAGFHFVSEWLVFGTAKLGKGLYGPLFVASVTTAWMLTQRDFYLH
ncbi:ergosterol biosynthetic protein 28 [Trichomonascus vanleenenianus]|uniref:Erg28p n=1 Tax=Trichomonascus vanleenenianus TaxID=2268995 RepID=UPI003ECB1C49